MQCATPIDDAEILAQAKEDSENFKKRLRKDLMNKDGHRYKITAAMLFTKNKKKGVEKYEGKGGPLRYPDFPFKGHTLDFECTHTHT